MSPSVSVIIPVRNYERFVAMSVESVLSQTFTDWELIIVDDCSDDKTPSIASHYADGKRIRLERNPTNLGQFATHNRGAALARGTYLKFLHGDDLMYPHCLDTMVRAMNAFPDAGLGISHPAGPWRPPHQFSPEDAWRAQLSGQYGMLCESPSATIFRRSVFEAAGGFDDHFSGDLADMEMNFRIAMRDPALLLPAGLWWWRLHGKQITTLRFAEERRLKSDINNFEWLNELLENPESPLTTTDRLNALHNNSRNFSRLILRYALRMRFRQAGILYRGPRRGTRGLLLGMAARKPVSAAPVPSATSSHAGTASGRRDVPDSGTAGDRVPSSAEVELSVIITGDDASAVQASIASVLEQQSDSWEILVGTTTAGTATAAPHASDPDPRIRFCAADSGEDDHVELNKYASAAQGRHLLFLHAGDLLGPGCLASVTALTAAHPEAGLLQSHEKCPYCLPARMSPAEVFRQELFGSVRLWQARSRTFYRRESFLRAGGFHDSSSTAHVRLNLTISQNQGVVIIYGGLVHCREDDHRRKDLRLDRGYGLADVAWLRCLFLKEGSPLDQEERRQADANLRAIHRNLQLLRLIASRGLLRRLLRPLLELPYAHDPDYWHRYGTDYTCHPAPGPHAPPHRASSRGNRYGACVTQ